MAPEPAQPPINNRLLTTDMPRQTLSLFLLALLLLTAAGCVTQPRKPDAVQEPVTAKTIYEKGKAALTANDFEAAAQQFRILEASYPDDPFAIQAHMELAYAYYRAGDTASTIATAERFMRKYPDNPNVDYLYYLRGLASYDETIAFINGAEKTADPDMPPMSNLTLYYFTELAERFPDSKYTQDAKVRIKHLRERLAGLELQRAKAAIERSDYATAALHARAVMENYPNSSHDREAAALTNMVYRMLDIENQQGKQQNVVIPMSGKEAPRAAPPKPAANIASQIPRSPALQAATSAAKPVEDRRVVAPSGSAPGLKRESWLKEQTSDSYTLQLLGTVNEQSLVNFARRNGIEDRAAYFTTLRDGRPWYTLVYGSYPDPVSARAAIKALPPALRNQKPWIRRMSDIQALIDGAAR